MTTDEKLRKALEQIKGLVTGDKIPNWQDHWRTTSTRARIADIADAALVPAPPESRDTPTTGAGTAAYEEGYLHGLREYAHWKDGVQYVGTCGKTLADAIAEFKEERCMPSAAGGAAGATTAAQEPQMTEPEIDETVGFVVDAGQVMDIINGCPTFGRDLQIRDAGERGLGLVWDGGECWALMPDPFYTKEFLSTLRAQCNRMRRAKSAAASDGPGTRGGRKA
jgi:hypothetical protein